MKILVDKKPNVSQACLFALEHIEYSKRMCVFGGFCKLETNKKCNRLQDVNEKEQ